MNTFENIQNVYFLGIGGIGMSALARLFKHLGYQVAGYDARPTELTAALEQDGIKVTYTDKVDEYVEGLIPSETLVVLTPAIKDGELLEFFRGNGFAVEKRAKVLGMLVNRYPVIAIAGTHGKTTTTAITSHILMQAGKLSAGFVGGIAKNYGSNLILGHDKQGYIVVEADEYDRSFLHLHPSIAVITTVDADHLDIYGGYKCIKSAFEEFISGTEPNSVVILHKDIDLNTSGRKTYKYGESTDSDFYFVYSGIKDTKQVFEICIDGRCAKSSLVMPGKANLNNALAAAAAAYMAGVGIDDIVKGLESFQGVERRFDIRYNDGQRVIIDDYAHHPSEIAALNQAAREFFPGKNLTIVFQPHLYSRTRDFADDFAKELAKFDSVIVTDIYPAREKPIKGVDGKMLADLTGENAKYLPKDSIVDYLQAQDFEVILFVGAGDINMLVERLKKQIK